MSRFEPTLRDLAMEPDEERRLEMAAEIDRDAEDLDENWANRDGYAELEAERDRVAAERDEALVSADQWKARYADRFFDSNARPIGTGGGIVAAHADDIKEENRPKGYAALWADMED